MTGVYTIKNYRNIPSDYGYSRENGYSVTVYRNDKRLGTYTLPANGGVCAQWNMTDHDWKRLVDDAWDKAGHHRNQQDGTTEDALVVGIFLEPIIEKYEQTKEMR